MTELIFLWKFNKWVPLNCALPWELRTERMAQVHINFETGSQWLHWTLILAHSFISCLTMFHNQSKTQDLLYEDPSLYLLGWINTEWISINLWLIPMENLTEWTVGRPTKKPQTLPAVKVVEPRHTPITFILHDFIEVMLIKMKGLFEDVTIYMLNSIYFIHIYYVYYVIVCRVYYSKSFSKELCNCQASECCDFYIPQPVSGQSVCSKIILIKPIFLDFFYSLISIWIFLLMSPDVMRLIFMGIYLCMCV